MNHASQSGAAKTRVSVMLSLSNSQDGLCTRSYAFLLSLSLHYYNLPHYHPFSVNGSMTPSKQLLSLKLGFNHVQEE